ncbi:hypothetical protein BRC97_06985 [Halobacteriales archaeon QS_6_71_20]|nr:MAG: hypothetical protein BRC97_06985 [Halobacteriales archaeon QS_6_71_20]
MSETQSVSDDGVGRSEHTDRAAEAATETGMTWFERDVSAQDHSGSVRTVWPQPWARAAGVGHKTDVTAAVHIPTGALVSLPPGLSLEEFVSVIRNR